jgi:hypothetical protein
VLESQLVRGLSWFGNASLQHDLNTYERLLRGRSIPPRRQFPPLEMAG